MSISPFERDFDSRVSRHKPAFLFATGRIRHLKSLAPYFVFAGLAFFSLRDVLAMPGMIGHQWDWRMSAFPEQALAQAQASLSIWDDWIGGGSYNVFQIFYESFYQAAFGLLGGELQSKALVFLLLFLCGCSIYLFSRRSLGITMFWGTVSGVLFMLSPVTYSRLYQGHLSIILGYALLPFLSLCCLRLLEAIRLHGHVPTARLVATGLVLGITMALHSSLLVIAIIVTLAFFMAGFAWTRARQMLVSLVAVSILAGLVNASWGLPFAIGYLSSGSIFHTGESDKPPEQMSGTSIVPWRQSLLETHSQPMLEAVRQNGDQDAGEYMFPVPQPLRAAWLGVSTLIALVSFAVLLDGRRLDYPTVALALIGMVGVTMVAGVQIPTGTIFYDSLKRLAIPVWAEFSVTVRAMPLVVFSYAVLAPLALHRLAQRIQSPRAFIIGTVFVIVLVLVWTSPFLSGDIGHPGQTDYALKTFPVDSNDRALYDLLKINPDRARMMMIPPPGIWGASDIGWYWDVGARPPRPKFLAPSYNPEAWRAASDFSLPSANTRAGKILGLAAVDTVVYVHKYIDGTLAKPMINARLEAQQDLSPMAQIIQGVTIYSNKAYLPRVYAAKTPVLIEGTSDLISPLSTTPYLSSSPALFFSAQQSSGDLQFLSSDVSTVVEPIHLQVPVTSTVSASLPASQPSNATVYFAPVPASTLMAKGAFSVAQPGQFVVRSSVSTPVAPVAVDAELMYTQTVYALQESPQAGEWQVERSLRPPKIESISSSTNTVYDLRRDGPDMIRARVWIADAFAFTQFEKSVPAFDLRRYPKVSFRSSAIDPSIQVINLILGLDWNGDGIADNFWELPIVPKTDVASTDISPLESIDKDFPGHSTLPVVSIALRLKGRTRAYVENNAALYDYVFGNVVFSDGVSQIVPVDFSSMVPEERWEPARPSSPGLSSVFPTSQNASAVLTRALPAAEIAQYPLLALGYRVDGPGALAVELMLDGADAQGHRETVSLGTRLLQPFSEGTLVFNAKTSGLLRTTGVSVRADMLAGTEGQRETELSISKFSVARQELRPYREADPPLPSLTVDGKPIMLSRLSANTDRSGAWFASSPIDLAGGTHTIAAGYEEVLSPYRVDAIEVAPAGLQAKEWAAPAIRFRQISPTLFVADVESATAPYFLVFSESYHPDWKAYLISGHVAPTWYETSALLSGWFGPQRVELKHHFNVNGFANSWYVNELGPSTILIEFTPQRVYEASLGVSVITLVLSMCIILAGLWRK